MPLMTTDFYQRLFSLPFRETEPELVSRVDEARNAFDAEGECRALCNLAFARIHMGFAGSAVASAARAITLASSHGLHNMHLESRLWHDMAVHFSNDRSSQTQLAELGAELSTSPLAAFAPVCEILALRERLRSHPTEDVLEQCMNIASRARTAPNIYVRVFVLRLAGMALAGNRHISEALEMLEESRVGAEQNGLLSQLARTLSAIGAAYVDDNRAKEGLTELLAALPLYERLEIRDWYVAQTNLHIAILQDQHGDVSNAIGYAQRAMEIFLDVGDHEEAARSENVLGTLFERGGDPDRAYATYVSANDRFRSVESRHRVSTLPLANAAFILSQQGNTTEAIALLQEALDRATSINSAIGMAQANAYIGMVYDTAAEPLQNAERARHHLETGLRIAYAAGTDPTRLLDALSRHHERHYQFEEALAYTRKLHAHKDAARDETMQRRIAQLDARRRIEEAYKLAEIEHLRNVELKAAQAKLVESEKMASLGQLTAGIAHEINNPVTFIASSIAPLRRDLAEYEQCGGTGPQADELREEIRALLDGIESGAKRTAEIVRSLRTFSRLDEGAIKPADLIAGIESTLTILASRIRGRIRLERYFDPIPNIECRPGQINQVLMNIISNAIDAVDTVADPCITIATRLLGSNTVQIEIADNGSGIPPSILGRLFEPFFTTKDVGKGTGLGLSISYGIIEQHSGRIDVANRGGAVFTITLPIRQTLNAETPRRT